MLKFNKLATVDISHHVFVDSLLCSTPRTSPSVSIRLHAISKNRLHHTER